MDGEGHGLDMEEDEEVFYNREEGEGEQQPSEEAQEVDFHQKCICPSLAQCETRDCPYFYHLPTKYVWRVNVAWDMWDLFMSNGGEKLTPYTVKVKDLKEPEKGEKVVLALTIGKKLESLYSIPDITTYKHAELSVDFKKMTINLDSNSALFEIERLSTPSRTLVNDVNATEWFWYWQSDDPDVNWSEINYRRKLENDEPNPFALLEDAFLISKNKKLNLDVHGKNEENIYKMTLYPVKMVMFDKGLEEELEVRRRPATFGKYVDWSFLDDSRAGLTWTTFGELNPNGDTRYPFTAEEMEANYMKKNMEFSKEVLREKFQVQLNMKCISISSLLKSKAKISENFGRSIRIRREVFQEEQLLDLSQFPDNWDPMPKCRICVTPTVPEGSQEFQMVQELMTEGGGYMFGITRSFTVSRVRRIQNPATYRSYMEHKASFEAMYPGTTIEEKWLFHGTDDVNMKLICDMNFDPNLSGTVHGAVYGRGTYFALNASYSLSYCKSKSISAIFKGRKGTIRKMFLCKVLVGPTSSGFSFSQRSKYITFVNNTSAPSIFVKQMEHSFRPEYIVDIHESGNGSLY